MNRRVEEFFSRAVVESGSSLRSAFRIGRGAIKITRRGLGLTERIKFGFCRRAFYAIFSAWKPHHPSLAWWSRVCAGASFFFSLAETAPFSSANGRCGELSLQAGRGSVAARLLAEPQDLIATIALGNTFANVAMLALGLWMGLGGHWPLWGAMVVVLVLSVFVGRCCQNLCGAAARRWARRVAHPLAWSQRVTRVVHRLAQRLNRGLMAVVIPASVKPQTALTDDYRELVEFAFQQGNLAAGGARHHFCRS